MEHVRLAVEDGIAEVRLERGKVNALDERVVAELSGCFRGLAEDPAVRASILTGSGKFFSFGFDIPHFLGFSKAQFADYLRGFTGLYAELFAHPKPVVAALNGHAVAGGCMLATACDARVMEGGKIGLNEIGFGSSVFAGSAAILAFWVGPRRAQEVLYSAKLYSPEEALAMGLVDEIGGGEAARARARELGGRDAVAFRSVKAMLRRAVLEEIREREAASIEEFVEIWYSEATWRRLQAIKIR